MLANLGIPLVNYSCPWHSKCNTPVSTTCIVDSSTQRVKLLTSVTMSLPTSTAFWVLLTLRQLLNFVLLFPAHTIYGLTIPIAICILSPRFGSGQSVDCPVQTSDPRFAQPIHGFVQVLTCALSDWFTCTLIQQWPVVRCSMLDRKPLFAQTRCQEGTSQRKWSPFLFGVIWVTDVLSALCVYRKSLLLIKVVTISNWHDDSTLLFLVHFRRTGFSPHFANFLVCNLRNGRLVSVSLAGAETMPSSSYDDVSGCLGGKLTNWNSSNLVVPRIVLS